MHCFLLCKLVQYLQGDVERSIGLTISRFMDRDSPEVAACQMGFIDFIVMPIYKALGDFSPAIRAHCIPLIETNRATWADAQKRFPVTAAPPVPPLPPTLQGVVRPAEATSGVRSFPSAALPNRYGFIRIILLTQSMIIFQLDFFFFDSSVAQTHFC